MEKMTRPANMLVQELIQQTMMESLKGTEQISVKETHRWGWRASSSLLVHVVVVRVVASQRDERAQAEAVGEEDLCRRVQPHLLDNEHNHVRLEAAEAWGRAAVPQSGSACWSLAWCRRGSHLWLRAEWPHGRTRWTAWSRDRWLRNTPPSG